MADLDIPKLVKKLREMLGLTLADFAHKIGVTFGSVNRWENGKRTPQPFLIRRPLEMKEELDAQKSRRRRGSHPDELTASHPRWRSARWLAVRRTDARGDGASGSDRRFLPCRGRRSRHESPTESPTGNDPTTGPRRGERTHCDDQTAWGISDQPELAGFDSTTTAGV